MRLRTASTVAASLLAMASTAFTAARPSEQGPAELDTAYQAAVKRNDTAAMDRILDDHFVLVTGTGAVFTKADLLKAARDRDAVFEHQEDTRQTVRYWGNTAVVTALLWEKGTMHGQPFDKHLWFSDTSVHTPSGWKYAFGQASLALPPAP